MDLISSEEKAASQGTENPYALQVVDHGGHYYTRRSRPA
jgi:hypothetical protein